MRNVQKNDNVLVLAGKDRGKTGVVRQVLPKYDRAIVEGVNIIHKHQRPLQSGGVPTPGGIIAREAALHMSNLMVVCKSCNKPTRTGARFRPDGVKVRVCKKCGADID